MSSSYFITGSFRSVIWCRLEISKFTHSSKIDALPSERIDLGPGSLVRRHLSPSTLNKDDVAGMVVTRQYVQTP